jgi:hypothetical protein
LITSFLHHRMIQRPLLLSKKPILLCGSDLMLLFYNEFMTQSSNMIQPLNLPETNDLTYSSITKTLGLST